VTKTIWISVEYRLAPEYKYPIWLNDASDVAQYIIENKQSFGMFSYRKSIQSINCD
jgi:acetyl esterase/lipase